MTTNITIAVPLEAVAAIQGGTNAEAIADAITATTKAAVEAIKKNFPKAAAEPKAIKAEEGVRKSIKVRLPNGKCQPVIINASYTVDDLKTHLCGLTSVSPCAQRLFYKGIQMEEGRLLCYYGFEEGSVLHMLTKPDKGTRKSITVKFLNGEEYPIEIDTSNTVDDLKNYLYGPTPWPPDQQRFIYVGKQLEDGRQLCEYGIEDGAVIYLITRARGS